MFVKQTLLVMLADCFARMRKTKKKRKQLLFKSHFTSSVLEALRGCLKVKVLFSRFCSFLVLPLSPSFLSNWQNSPVSPILLLNVTFLFFVSLFCLFIEDYYCYQSGKFHPSLVTLDILLKI